MDGKEAHELLVEVFDEICDKADEVGFKNLSKLEQYVFAIWQLDAEVCNGGFHQYMVNSFSDHALVALEGLEEMGARDIAEVCKKFFALLPGGKPAATDEERQEQLEAVEDAMGEEAFDEQCAKLEERLYGLNGDLYERMAAFVRAKGLGGA